MKLRKERKGGDHSTGPAGVSIWMFSEQLDFKRKVDHGDVNLRVVCISVELDKKCMRI